MKNILFILVLCTSFTARAQFAGGTGTEDDPWQITTLAQLDSVRTHTGKQTAGWLSKKAV